MDIYSIPRYMTSRPDVFAVSLVIHILALALPLSLLQVYDRILPNQAWGTTSILVIGVGLAIILEAILRYGRGALFARIGERYEAEKTLQVFDRLLKADIAEVEKRGSVRIVDSVRAIATVRDHWSGSAAIALYELPFVAVYIGLIAYIGGWLALIPLGLFVITLGVSLLALPATKRAVLQAELTDRKRRNFLWSLFAGLAEIKSRGAEPSLTRCYGELNEDYLLASAKLEQHTAWVRENASLVSQLASVLVVIFGAMQVMDGQLTTGALAACTLLAGRSIAPVIAGLSYLARTAQIDDAEQKLRELTDIPTAAERAQTDSTQHQANITNGAIKISAQASFAQSIEIKAGEAVQLYGADNTRVSSLMAAVAGLTHNHGIQVQIDGIDPLTLPVDTLREDVCLVPRQPAMIPGSILNNLTLYDPRFNQSARDYAAKLGLLNMTDHLQHGLLTNIGALMAESLNEGMYQRVALIRALVRQPKVLLLDHADRGLDIDGCKRLARVLQELHGHTTVLVSTGREDIIACCDRTLDLKTGQP
ncbi:ABC transporter transmembrane domain-containing protein [Gilvimarinus japonicus]|uniref:ABC transporter transmembrane domain-containing protein n=1 Tax=Gilvimarinus japonicus TaxID=1796469 RepID=A0ABV7HPY4_9GAMM